MSFVPKGEPETWMTDMPVCPYCGNLERDAWEINFGGGCDGDTDTDCGACGKTYHVSRQCSFTYTTTRKA